MLAVGLLLFQFFQRSMSEVWLELASHPRILNMLDQAAQDQKTLSRLDPQQTELYRARFEEITEIRNYLLILEHSRENMISRFEMMLWAALALTLIAGAVLQMVYRLRLERRINALRDPLFDLAAGKTNVRVPVRGRDAVGRVARLITKTSRQFARQAEQLRYLRHLSGWQEAARRHAHEIRTPLTAAQMELERLAEMDLDDSQTARNKLLAGLDSIQEELVRLRRFTQEFTAFAKTRAAQPEPADLAGFLTDFIALFQGAWPNLELSVTCPEGLDPISLDREMVRQVLVNLVNNSAKALAGRSGHVHIKAMVEGESIALDVVDDGPGIDDTVIDNLFEPYATTSKVGEGMGLGLPIARKMMLDHGGDLELLDSGREGAVFRLRFPAGETPGTVLEMKGNQ